MHVSLSILALYVASFEKHLSTAVKQQVTCTAG